MKPTQLDHVRDALRRETEHLQPVGLEIEDVKRRGSRRRNRSRALVAVATVTCLTGVGVTVAQSGDGDDGRVVDISGPSASSTPPPALQFRVVDGTVGYATHFTSSDGVTYALSTAPGTAANPAQPGQAIYSTKDGETWTTRDQGEPWISDLSEGGGVLYAIGTAPGEGDDVLYRVGTSEDGGGRWSMHDLPFSTSTPSATVSLSHSASVQLARGASSTVALLTEQFLPDIDELVAQRTSGHENVSTRQTDDGFEMLDLGDCMASKRLIDAEGPATADGRDAAKAGLEADCANPPSLGTITWSDIGLNSGGDLSRQQVLVSTNGSDWEQGTAPGTGFVSDIQASGDGYLLLAINDREFRTPAAIAVTLMRSTDARTWTEVATPAGLNVQAIAGDRVIGLDADGGLQTSTDGGSNWTATNVGSKLPAGGPNAAARITDAGPLGFAVIANSDANSKDGARGVDYLLFSTDGITWSTTDLATTAPPANAYPMQVTVGADHIGIDYEGPTGVSNAPMKTTTVLATPKR